VSIVNRGESFLYRDGEWIDWCDEIDDYANDFNECVLDNFWIKAYATLDSGKVDNPLYDALLILIVAGVFASYIAVRRR
jgi:hypothetical protein